MTRKTLSLPAALVERIQGEANADRRSFNSVAVERLSALFLPSTVGQFAGLAEAEKAGGRRSRAACGPEGAAATGTKTADPARAGVRRGSAGDGTRHAGRRGASTRTGSGAGARRETITRDDSSAPPIFDNNQPGVKR